MGWVVRNVKRLPQTSRHGKLAPPTHTHTHTADRRKARNARASSPLPETSAWGGAGAHRAFLGGRGLGAGTLPGGSSLEYRAQQMAPLARAMRKAGQWLIRVIPV